MLKKQIWAKFQRIIELFTQQNVTKRSKIWVWDPGSGSRDQKGTGFRIRNTALNCMKNNKVAPSPLPLPPLHGKKHAPCKSDYNSGGPAAMT